MRFSEGIFKAYDIRGVFGKEFGAEFAYALGRSFVSFLTARTVVVGCDARKSSPALFKELVRGITDQGANVIDIGLCSTPMFYFAVAKYKYDGGIMVTASHNPAEFNGFKLTREQAIPIGDDSGLSDIKKFVQGSFKTPKAKGRLIKQDIISDYCKHVLSRVSHMDKFKVVVDAGNGMAGHTEPRIFASLPVKLIPMYFEVDMSFPNHEANPIKFETLKELQKRVVKEKADIGIAFDGDVDRVFFVDEKGGIVPGDFTTALIAEALLEEHPGSTVLYDLRSSWVVKETILANKGVPEMCRVGHAFIKRQMRSTGAIFAGELSGHFYYRDNFYTESAIITALKIMELMTKKKKRLSELVAPLRKYFQSGEINTQVKDAKAILTRVEKQFEGKKISHLDGLMVENRDFWFNIRPSNTEPVVRFTAEAKTKERLKEIQEKVLSFLQS
jgi:phosphomannomutase